MLKEKLKNFKLSYLLYILLTILLVACIVLFIQNYRMSRTIKSIYGTGFNGSIQDRKFTREYDRLARDYERKVDELIELQNDLMKRDIFNDFYDDGWMTNCRHRRHWDYYDNNMRRHFNRFERQLNRSGEASIRDTRTFTYNSKIERDKDNFILKVKIPKVFTLDDVKVDFRNRNLLVKIEKEDELKSRNEERRYYNSFFESFLVPETKAKLENVRVSLNKDNDNELVIVVPIL